VMSSPEPRSAKNAMTVWVVRHPGQWGVVSGLIAFSMVGLLFLLPVSVCVVVVVPFGFANWLAWRRDGPAHRLRAWVLRRYPPET
jgi:hypothetical protein